MISSIKKNEIDLFSLKNKSDLKNVEQAFHKFLKALFRKKKNFFYKKNNCACGNKSVSRKVKIDLFEYLQCKCGTYYINPMIKDDTLNLIYSNKGPYALYRKKFIENKRKKNLRMNTINKRKAHQVFSFLKNKNKRLLDFGCGDGGFLRVCKKYGMRHLSGIDTRYSQLEKKNGITFSNNLNNLNINQKFDCITLWGVLEHLNEPTKFLKNILFFLNKNGFILLEVPYSESVLMEYAVINKKKLDRFLEPGRHLYFFSNKFFKIIAKKLKMKLIDFETNGLDLQTIIGPTKKIITKKLIKMQNKLDHLKISDHARFVLQKK